MRSPKSVAFFAESGSEIVQSHGMGQTADRHKYRYK